MAAARDLVDEMARARARAPIPNPLLGLAREGRVTTAHLLRLTRVERMYHDAELAAYGTLLARFPDPDAAALFIDVAGVVQEARLRLDSVIRSLGGDPDEESGAFSLPRFGVTEHGFCGYVSWLALNGSQAAAALALYSGADGVYYGGSAALVEQLRKRDATVPGEFLDYYAGTPSERQNDHALRVAQQGLDRGDSPAAALEAARLCDDYMALLWQAAAGAPR